MTMLGHDRSSIKVRYCKHLGYVNNLSVLDLPRAKAQRICALATSHPSRMMFDVELAPSFVYSACGGFVDEVQSYFRVILVAVTCVVEAF